MIVIIDYNLSNLNCVLSAVKYLGFEAKITNDLKYIKSASKLILPGVGAFPDAIKNLKKLNLIDVLNQKVLIEKIPFLGICLGAQLICKSSEEFELKEGLNWVNAHVKRLTTKNNSIRIPHTGWNDIVISKKKSLLLEGFSNEENLFYFNHSYVIVKDEDHDVVGYCNHGKKFVSVIEKDNIFATQFHPEKSQKNGLKLLKNFLQIEK